MRVKVLTEHYLETISLKGCYTGSSESTHVKMPHCWKSHVIAHIVGVFTTCTSHMLHVAIFIQKPIVNGTSTELSIELVFITTSETLLFSYFSTKTCVGGTQKKRLNRTVLLGTQNICLI